MQILLNLKTKSIFIEKSTMDIPVDLEVDLVESLTQTFDKITIEIKTIQVIEIFRLVVLGLLIANTLISFKLCMSSPSSIPTIIFLSTLGYLFLIFCDGILKAARKNVTTGLEELVKKVVTITKLRNIPLKVKIQSSILSKSTFLSQFKDQ